MPRRPPLVPTRRGEVLVVDPRPLFAQGVATAFDPVVDRVLTIEPGAVADVSPGRGVAIVAFAAGDVPRLVTTLVASGRRVLVHGPHRRDLPAAIAAGAAGFFGDDAEAAEVRAAVQAVRRGATWFPEGTAAPPAHGFALLTRRERAVLVGLLDGLRPADIAERDFVAVVTVRNQVQSILTKLNVHSQLEAVALAHARGWTADAA